MLNKSNHLLLQDSSIDKILTQIIADCGLTEELDKIDQALNFPGDMTSENQSASREVEQSPLEKRETDSTSNKFEEEKE